MLLVNCLYDYGLTSAHINKNCVPHMAVHKVNPEVGPFCQSLRTPLHWASDSFQNWWEWDLIVLSLPGGGGGWGGGGGIPCSPVPLCAGFCGAPGGNPPPDPRHTPGTVPNAAPTPGKISRSLSTVFHIPTPTIHKVCYKADTTWSPSSAHSCGGWTSQRGL